MLVHRVDPLHVVVRKTLEDGLGIRGATRARRYVGAIRIVLHAVRVSPRGLEVRVCHQRRPPVAHRLGGEANQLESVAEARGGTLGALPAILDRNLDVGIVSRARCELVRGARDAAFKLCVDGSKPVEHRELPAFLVSGQRERRDLGMLLNRLERGIPRQHRLRVTVIHALRRRLGRQELAGRIAVDELREQLQRNRAVRGGADVCRHARTDEIADAGKVLGEVILQTLV